MAARCAVLCRYVAKLFRDFVFHQVDEEGAPLLDYGLMAEALNKADAGVPEKASMHQKVLCSAGTGAALLLSGLLPVWMGTL